MDIDIFGIYLHSVTCRVHFSEEDHKRTSKNSVLSFLDLFKVTVDLQGCLPKNHLYARRLCFNHRKEYIIAKLKKCKIRKINIFKISFNGKRKQAFKRKTDTIC